MTTTKVVQAPVRIRDLFFMIAMLLIVPAVVVLAFWRPARMAVLELAVFIVLAELIRFIVLVPNAAKRHYAAARWHKIRWHRLSRNLGLSYQDRHVGGLDSARLPTVNYPRARFTPDRYGWTVRLRLIPGVGRAEVEKAAGHLADAWKCHRVGVTQPSPGRLVLRAMRFDPLAVPLSASVVNPFAGNRILLGRDELGQLRHVSLANVTGTVIAGNPGRGKSVLAGSVVAQVAQSRLTSLYLVDAKGGADWTAWRDRCAAYAEDDLAEAVAVLEQAHERMVHRLRTIRDHLGVRNAWSIGPTASYPLLLVLVDECHWLLDLESAKTRGKEAELAVRRCRSLIGDMLRRGRSVLTHVCLVTQKPTSSSIPPDLRDLCGVRICFGVSVTEAAVAALGDDIRQFPTVNPTGLQGEEHVGVCVVRMPTGSDVFTRIRAPHITEATLDGIAAATAELGPGGPPCLACVGDDSARCTRCKGSGTDPDPSAPVLWVA